MYVCATDTYLVMHMSKLRIYTFMPHARPHPQSRDVVGKAMNNKNHVPEEEAVDR